MNHPAFRAITKVGSDILESYKDDMLIHDRAMLQEFPDSPFLWFCRSSGSHMIPLGVGKISSKDKEIVQAMWGANSDHFAWNGEELSPLSREQADVILQYFLPLKIQL
mgnify:CR=1 FL=1